MHTARNPNKFIVINIGDIIFENINDNTINDTLGNRIWIDCDCPKKQINFL